jgi:hypothetical protein
MEEDASESACEIVHRGRPSAGKNRGRKTECKVGRLGSLPDQQRQPTSQIKERSCMKGSQTPASLSV